MNYLELQQRANILVNKVNEYESNLTGQTIDESEILEQHLYADIFSLRPVMKMLFGKDLTEKLNRTLENDVDLKVYALNSPMNRTSFSLLSSYNPYPLTRKLSELVTPVGSISYDDEGWTNIVAANSGYYTANVSDFLPDLNSPVEYRVLKIYYKKQTSYTSAFPIEAIDSSNQRNEIIPCSFLSNYHWLMSPPQFGLTSRSNDGIQIPNIGIGTEILVEVTIKPIPDEASESWKNGCYYYADYTVSNVNTGEVYGKSTSPYYIISLVQHGNPSYLPIKQIQLGYYNSSSNRGWSFNVEKSTVEIYKTSFEEGYTQEVVHDNVISLDTYNNHNMLIQDAYVNTVVDRDTRIKAGINYSYSSNIQDALVTESQVANLFKWNTTTSLDIANNSMSINRQVPGIVVYYLGTDYDSTYTATIPYNPGSIKLNQINYSTPPYYGAYYMTDETQSQIGLQMGAEACRIFMPGLNYTRGQLESPQQIWQPDRLVGASNVGLGYNWQGGSVYHELVFKNRRQGSQDAGVDFISPVESDIDNDPQGLALRTALAQQRPYYYNRLWFSELDELYGTNMEKVAEIAGNLKKIGYIEHFTKTGNPTVTSDYLISNTSRNNYITCSNILQIAPKQDSFSIIGSFTTGDDVTTEQGIFSLGINGNENNCRLFLEIASNNSNLFVDRVALSSGWLHILSPIQSTTIEPNKKYFFKIEYQKPSDAAYGDINVYWKNPGEAEYTLTKTEPYDPQAMTEANFAGFGSYFNSSMFFKGIIDLKDWIINGNKVDCSPLEETEVAAFANDTEYFNNFRLEYDTWAQALDKAL